MRESHVETRSILVWPLTRATCKKVGHKSYTLPAAAAGRRAAPRVRSRRLGSATLVGMPVRDYPSRPSPLSFYLHLPPSPAAMGVLEDGGRESGSRCPGPMPGWPGLFESRIARIARRQKAAIRAESRGAQ